MLKKMTMYFNSEKSSNFEQFGKFCENKKAEEECVGIGYEIKIEGKFNTKTGKFFAYSLNGIELRRSTEI